jgi:LPXTG-site transpeptidase (sortase) family protein
MRVQFNRYFKKLLSVRKALIVVAVVTLLVLLHVVLTPGAVSQDNSIPPIAEKAVSVKNPITPGLPERLIIPSINVNVAIDYVGLTADGSMDIKANPQIVGWYMLGPRPGDKGNAVIAGHYGWEANGAPAIFNTIQNLNKGDELSVIDQKGQTFTFVVREIRTYSAEADASAVFKSKDNSSHLNLVTCNGVWVNDKQSYSDRLVVFTDIKP